jgi:hypothetical protein
VTVVLVLLGALIVHRHYRRHYALDGSGTHILRSFAVILLALAAGADWLHG